MSNRFHNKFHRHNHHTDATLRGSLYPDSAYDPIASYESPFMGNFYLSGDLVGFKSGYFYKDFYVYGETTRLETNTYITSATDIFTANVTDDVPALKVTQMGGIFGAPIARFLGNVDPGKDTGEFTIIFDKQGQVGIGTIAPESITHIKQQSPTKPAELILDSISTNSILRLDSFSPAAIHFAKKDVVRQTPYAIIQGDNLASLIITSSDKDVVTILDSPDGNSFLLEKIGTNLANNGGLIVQSGNLNCGRIVINKSGTTRIQTGNLDEDVIVAYPTRDVLMTNNVSISGSTTIGKDLLVLGSTTIRENLLVLGDNTNLDTNVNITSAVDIFYTGADSALTITQTTSSAIARLVNLNFDAETVTQSLSGKSIMSLKGVQGNKIDFYEFDSSTPYFSISADNSLSALKLYSDKTTNSQLIIQSETNDSILTLKSLTGGKVDFRQNNDTSYSIIGSPKDKGLKFVTNLSSTLVHFESLSGNSFLIQTINPLQESQSAGGILINTSITPEQPNTSRLGSFMVDVSGTIHIASKTNPDAITIVSDDGDSNLYSKVGVSTTRPNKELTVNGEISASDLISDPVGNSSQWNSVYSQVGALSSNWTSVYTTTRNTSAIWDTVVLRLPLSGGTLSGLLKLQPQDGVDALKIWGDVTIFGNLSSTGLQSFANTVFSTTSAISVVNVSSATALYVNSKGSGDIASFYDGDTGVEVLHIGGTESLHPNVGIKTSTPNVDFTVKGSISASNAIFGDVIYDRTNDSTQWGSTYTTTSSNSANWQSAYTTVFSNSAIWANTLIVEQLTVSVSADNNFNVVLSNTTLDHELTGVHTGVASITSFSNSRKGNVYSLTNKTEIPIIIAQSPKIFVRQGHSWRATNSAYTNSFLTLPVSGTCAIRFGPNDIASVW